MWAVMADPAELLKRITWLHHFTDTRNLPKIKELGGLYSRHQLRNMGVKRLSHGRQPVEP
jgi:hypothetical protein